MWTDPAQDEAAVAWTRSAWEQMRAFGTGAPFLNFTGLADEPLDAGVGAAFGRNLERLRRVKTAYDPENFFRLNNNVLPLT